MPDCPDLIVPILYIIPAQLLSYRKHRKNTNVDNQEPCEISHGRIVFND